MSYPPPGPDASRPQDRPNSGWQPRPYQQQPYHPGGTGTGGPNWGGPGYGGPPKKNRAGLIIILTLVFLIAILGIGGVLAFGLVSGDNGASSPDPAPATSVAPPASTPTVARPQPTKTVKPPTAKPPVKPAGDPAEFAKRFVAQLNANNRAAASALACANTKALLPTLIEQWVAPPTKLTAGISIGQQTTFIVPISGTTKGSAVNGLILVRKVGNEPLCVQVFQLAPR